MIEKACRLLDEMQTEVDKLKATVDHLLTQLREVNSDKEKEEKKKEED